jgi:phage-related protein
MGKELMVLRGEIKTPPMSNEARREIGYLLRELQEGESLSLPQSRPMPGIGARCHELRVNEAGKTWRVIYRIDPDAIVVSDVFEKKTRTTPQRIVRDCRRRLRHYDEAAGA